MSHPVFINSSRNKQIRPVWQLGVTLARLGLNCNGAKTTWFTDGIVSPICIDYQGKKSEAGSTS